MDKRPRARVGQVWASTHRGDVEYGFRQRRTVVGVGALKARLLTEGQDRPTACSLDARGGIRGHRLVEDVPDVH